MLSIYQNRLITDKRIFNLATLHTYFRSSAAYRVRIFLALKGLSYQKNFINLKQSQQITKA
ncbi:Maleylacetoacetate isomerase Glutathione S-transferase, zeta [Moraxella catarrhalis]|nr:Maleylacetoacetate isomerase Glutathione S-transferase, zeta [Moraxella catarrhalis]